MVFVPSKIVLSRLEVWMYACVGVNFSGLQERVSMALESLILFI